MRTSFGGIWGASEIGYLRFVWEIVVMNGYWNVEVVKKLDIEIEWS